MPEKNVQIVRRLYEQWAVGDFSDREPFDEELEFEIDSSIFPDPVRAHGVDGMAMAWRDSLQAWTGWRAGPIERLTEVGDKIVVFNRVAGRGRLSGAQVDAPRAAVFTFRDGRIIGLLLTDRETALAAAGLSE